MWTFLKEITFLPETTRFEDAIRRAVTVREVLDTRAGIAGPIVDK